jgi:excisionase family DNA binding protein
MSYNSDHRKWNEMEPVLVSVDQAATVVGIGKSKLYELLLSGELKSLKIGRRRLIRMSALEEFVDGLAISQMNKCDAPAHSPNR